MNKIRVLCEWEWRMVNNNNYVWLVSNFEKDILGPAEVQWYNKKWKHGTCSITYRNSLCGNKKWVWVRTVPHWAPRLSDSCTAKCGWATNSNRWQQRPALWFPRSHLDLLDFTRGKATYSESQWSFSILTSNQHCKFKMHLQVKSTSHFLCKVPLIPLNCNGLV